MTKYINTAETAKLIRKALKEAFPDVKFSVKSKTYSGGSSINVNWTDGPNTAQVEAIAKHFEGSYFDGGIDYKGSIYHMMDGEQVRFLADFVFCNRSYSDAAVQRAIDRVYRKYAGNFRDDAEPRATVEDFNRGRLHSRIIPGMNDAYGPYSLNSQIHQALAKHSDRLKVQKSATLAKVFITHDDDYSRTNGSGFSVVPENL